MSGTDVDRAANRCTCQYTCAETWRPSYGAGVHSSIPARAVGPTHTAVSTYALGLYLSTHSAVSAYAHGAGSACTIYSVHCTNAVCTRFVSVYQRFPPCAQPPVSMWYQRFAHGFHRWTLLGNSRGTFRQGPTPALRN
eukprot:3562500-Rhodomonas_salina.2